MTLLDAHPTPRLDDEELAVLERVERVLSRHPYLRVDLGGDSAASRALEDTLSARLGLLHTEGVPAAGSVEARVLDVLQRAETTLRERVDATPTGMRYDTAVLLHPDPRVGSSVESAASLRSSVTARWETWRARRSARDVIVEKLRQNRDFFRHGAMLPLYWLRRRRIRKLVPRSVLEHGALRETYVAIEQIGPLVDNFAFKGASGLPLWANVGLADIAFLYMQLADELLDELAAASGGHDVAGRIVRSVYRDDTTERPLRSLTLGDISAAGVLPDAHVTKFGITLAGLFSVLDDLAACLDGMLAETTEDIRRATHLFLHHCFQTYLDEVDLCGRAPGRRADRLRLEQASWHFYRKNNMVMMLWLDLRARLLGLCPTEHADVIRRWGYLLAAFQIFDDLKDVALDLGRQPSYPLQIAANEFPSEFAWLESRFHARRAPITRDEVAEVSLRASGTVQRCMQWSRLIALAHFDNALLYAWDQRWRKSWMRRRASFNPRGASSRRAPARAVDRLLHALASTRRNDTATAVGEEELAYALDASAYDGSWEIYLALFPNIRAIYRFATLRMWMTAGEKARAARRLLRRRGRRAGVLVELADGDVDHQVARDRLEARSELLEV